MRDRQLRGSDGVGEVHVDALVAVAVYLILGLFTSRGVPKARPQRLEYTSSRADDVECAELSFSGLEQAIQAVPRGDIGFVEDRFRSVVFLAILVDELLGLWTKSQVTEEYIAAILKQYSGKFKVNA